MSDLKEYDFPVVRYRNGKPATFFRNKIVYAELHEKVVKRIAQLETELAEARKSLEKEQSRAGKTITLTVGELLAVADFYRQSDEDIESEKTIKNMPDWVCSETGEKCAAGIYSMDTEYPEHGLAGPFTTSGGNAAREAGKGGA